MSEPQFEFDREVITSSFREWLEEQQKLDSQLAESVAALDAYQANLDNWQKELTREREELSQLRAAIEKYEHEPAAAERSSDQNEQLELLGKELAEARELISSLTADLALARAHELELGEALVAEQHSNDTHAIHHEAFDEAVELAAAGSYRGDTGPSKHGRPDTRRGASPVLGSVMEQFGKLREQRSHSRSNTKPR